MKRYNMKETARIIGVHHQTIIYWIKKGWIKPKRDYRNLPVFTDECIKKIKKWRDTLRD